MVSIIVRFVIVIILITTTLYEGTRTGFSKDYTIISLSGIILGLIVSAWFNAFVWNENDKTFSKQPSLISVLIMPIMYVFSEVSVRFVTVDSYEPWMTIIACLTGSVLLCYTVYKQYPYASKRQ